MNRYDQIHHVHSTINFLLDLNKKVKTSSFKTLKNNIINAGLVLKGVDSNRYTAMVRNVALGNTIIDMDVRFIWKKLLIDND